MKYVYCIPHAGFNDVLCQMELAWSYARQHDRVFVVNTRRSALSAPFSEYFESLLPNAVLHPTGNLIRHLNSLSASPHCLQGRVDDHPSRYVPDNIFIDPETLTPLTFNFSARYAEDVLVHHCSGGGIASVQCLEKVRLREEVAKAVLDALSDLEDGYCAVHVRNTDYRTDYMQLFKTILPRVAGKTLVICSDDVACRETAKSFFSESTVRTASDIPDTGGAPIHMRQDDVAAKNMAMLIDLFALARAKPLFFANVEGGFLSGFTRLAAALHQRPELTASLLRL